MQKGQQRTAMPSGEGGRNYINTARCRRRRVIFNNQYFLGAASPPPSIISLSCSSLSLSLSWNTPKKRLNLSSSNFAPLSPALTTLGSPRAAPSAGNGTQIFWQFLPEARRRSHQVHASIAAIAASLHLYKVDEHFLVLGSVFQAQKYLLSITRITVSV